MLHKIIRREGGKLHVYYCADCDKRLWFFSRIAIVETLPDDYGVNDDADTDVYCRRCALAFMPRLVPLPLSTDSVSLLSMAENRLRQS